MLTDEQLKLRLTGVGASEVAAVCGLNPYRSLLSVYMDKVGLSEYGPESPASEWGNRLEAVIAAKYSEKLAEEGLILSRHSGETFRREDKTWMLCTPDGLVRSNENFHIVRGLEIKTAGFRQAWKWGDEEDSVPEPYLLQCAWSMAVMDVPRWDLAALIAGQDYREYVINRDMELEESLIKIVGEFWEHVLDKSPPEPDASESAKKALGQIYHGDEPTLLEATADAQEWAFKLKEAKAAAAKIGEEQMLAENNLKYIIAEHAGLEGVFGRITWKRSKDGQTTNWKEVAKELGAPDSVITKHTSTKPGSRRFLTRWAG